MVLHPCPSFSLMVASLLLAVQIQPGAAEAAYSGRDETLQVSVPTSLASSNATEVQVIVNTTVHVPLPLWMEHPLMPSWLATVIGLVGTLFFVLILLFVCFGGFASGGYKENWHVLYRAPVALCPCTAPELGLERMRMEVIMGLQMQYLFLAIAGLYGWAKGVHRLPGTLALLAVPWIGRNLHLNCLWAWGSREEDYAPVVPTRSEEGCCGRTLVKVKTAGVIMFGKLENLDAVSDGLAVASAYFVTDEVSARFAASFTSSTGVLGWLCRHLGIGNMMLAALLYGTAVQGSFALAPEDGNEDSGDDNEDSGDASEYSDVHFLADLGGFALPRKAGSSSSADDEAAIVELSAAFFVALARVCSESMVQALLQTSLVMAQGQSLVEQPVLAFSISLSCATLAGKAAGMIRNACFAWQKDDPDAVRLLLGIFNLCAALTTLAVLAIIVLKLYASQSCESRLWGLTTGCVDLV